jgi:hypothetical protein
MWCAFFMTHQSPNCDDDRANVAQQIAGADRLFDSSVVACPGGVAFFELLGTSGHPAAAQLRALAGKPATVHIKMMSIRFGVFFTSFTTNALLLIALITTGDYPKNPLVTLCIAAVGSCVIWLLSRIQDLALSYLTVYEPLRWRSCVGWVKLSEDWTRRGTYQLYAFSPLAENHRETRTGPAENRAPAVPASRIHPR